MPARAARVRRIRHGPVAPGLPEGHQPRLVREDRQAVFAVAKGGQARLLTGNRDWGSLLGCRVPHELFREGWCSTS